MTGNVAAAEDARLRRIGPLPEATSFLIDRMELTRPGHRPVPLVRKELALDRLRREAREVKPVFLHDPRREIVVYRYALPEQTGPPRCFGYEEDEPPGCFSVLLEEIPGSPLWQFGDLEVWKEAAAWLARFHLSRCRGKVPALCRRNLVTYDLEFFTLWAGRIREVNRPVSGDALGEVLEFYEGTAAELAAGPSTLVHGEFVPSNVLAVTGSSPVRIAPVDWELAGIGPPALDVAALVSGWERGVRDALVAAYRRQILAAGDPLGQAAGLERSVDLCSLHLCIRWLGWSHAWAPPAEHRRDWLEEAAGLVEWLDR